MTPRRRRRPHWPFAVTRASTYVFDSVAQWRETRQRRAQERVASYGARGTDSTYALEDALVLLEGGYRAKVFPTGLAAIAMVFLAYIGIQGDPILNVLADPAANLARQAWLLPASALLLLVAWFLGLRRR